MCHRLIKKTGKIICTQITTVGHEKGFFYMIDENNLKEATPKPVIGRKTPQLNFKYSYSYILLAEQRK